MSGPVESFVEVTLRTGDNLVVNNTIESVQSAMCISGGVVSLELLGGGKAACRADEIAGVVEWTERGLAEYRRRMRSLSPFDGPDEPWRN